MATKTRRISTLIESQLPGFIASEYENFSRILENYYEELESKGKPLDIVNNLTTYRDINYYDKNILTENTTLVGNLSNQDTSIILADGSSFPEQNGYIRIGDEICFYKERLGNELLEVSRGVSGNVTLGDLYDKPEFVTTIAEAHLSGSIVHNISNLFLYAFVKSFESEYLNEFPEKYLKSQIDKRTLIKNITSFYRSKGTEKSIQFIFNSIVSKDPTDVPKVYNPKDLTLKSSESDWVSTYSLKVKILSGDPKNLIGQRIEQLEPKYVSAIVDNVKLIGSFDDETLYELVLDKASIFDQFEVASKTELTKPIYSSYGTGDRIDVFSTLGWSKTGKFIIGTEEFEFDDKNVNQFIIKRRSSSLSYQTGSSVYSYYTVKSTDVSFIVLGVLYDLQVESGAPYSAPGDFVEISDPGFTSIDPVIFNKITNNIRWVLNENGVVPEIQQNPILQQAVLNLNADVSAIYEDDQYFYICSSSYPSHRILSSTTVANLKDQKHLKLIRKYPTNTTEVYKTPTRDIGVFVDGTIAFSHKDEEYLDFGKIENITLTNKGSGYAEPPYVIINGEKGKAKAFLSGNVVSEIQIETNDVFSAIPDIEIVSGRNAVVEPIVTAGKITSLVIANPGEYYSAPPTIRITDRLGKGRFAEYRAIISPTGELVDFEQIDEGKFYTKENVIVEIIPSGSGATAVAEIKKWYRNRFEKLKNNLDDSYGYVFENYLPDNGYGYGRLGNPRRLRAKINDNISNSLIESPTPTHSPILGFAYDGNPIYGPYGYSNPSDSSSSVVRMRSGYILNTSRDNGPSEIDYPLGSFTDDYVWVASIETGKTKLDKNNGRFCVTPDYPDGVYAYFITTNTSNIPEFPYILGENFYSLPVDSNYNSSISQLDLPKNVKRLVIDKEYRNGFGVNATIETVKSGFVSGVDVYSSPKSFKVGNKLVFDNFNTGGKDVSAFVSSVKGEDVENIFAKSSVVRIQTSTNCYLFGGEIFKQENTGVFGKIVGDVLNDNIVVLEEVSGVFSSTDTFTMENSSGTTIKVINLLLDTNSTYTKGATLELTNGKNKPDSVIAEGLVLESSVNQNSVKIKVTSGNFEVTDQFFIRSTDLSNTTGSKIVSISSLSENIESFTINDNYAIVKTAEAHRLAVNDIVNIDIIPDDNLTETEYFVRKKIYQTVKLAAPKFNTKVSNSGVGSFTILNIGTYNQTGTYDVEFNISNPTLKRDNVITAKGRIIIPITGDPTIQIDDPGEYFRTNDLITVEKINEYDDLSVIIDKLPVIRVDHAGFAISNTELILDNSSFISNEDYLKINDEIVKVISIDRSTNIATVLRAQFDTKETNHYVNNSISVYNPRYRFNLNYRPLGINQEDPFVLSYDENTQELTVSFDYNTSLETVNSIVQSNFIVDQSVPSKRVSIFSIQDPTFKLEFSEDNIDFKINPVIDIQKYYSYKFNTSHPSMTGTYLDFSSSINYNIFTEEIFKSDIEPGTIGSYVKVKLGFGPNIVTNEYNNKVPVNFKNYYYFILADGVNTDNSYLNVIEDPLAGRKVINYVTSNKFVYELSSEPQYNGSGNIQYNTSSRFAIGEINEVSINNSGIDYNLVPIIIGTQVADEYEASVTSSYDSITTSVTSVTVNIKGSNYVNPKIIEVNSDGSGAVYDAVVSNGRVIRVDIISGGSGYTYAPTLKVIEGSTKLYAVSKTIGVPQTVKLLFNGGSFHNDKTIISKYTSSYSLLLKDFNEYTISPGQIIRQKIGDTLVASGVVSNDGWKVGSNILKVRSIDGEFDSSLPILDRFDNVIANVISVLYTSFKPDIRSYFDNIGYYKSDRGKLSSSSQKLTDSYFYQDYSYVIKSKTPIDIWRDLINQTTHPAGFKLFGEVLIESEGTSTPPENQPPSSKITKIDLAIKSITVSGSQRKITQSVVKYNDLNLRRGYGSVSVDTFNTEETLAYEIILDKPFDGDFDPSTGQLVGTKTFTMLDKKSNTAVSAYNENQLIISVNDVVQEPGKAFTVSNNQITFTEPPLGDRVSEGQDIPAVSFYGKSFKFKNNTLNEQYLKKIRNIYQRNGRWLDSANQIRFNRTFIAAEAIGYAKEKYPNIAWNSLESKCVRDIGYILEAVEFDLRFGGNFKTIKYAETYFDGTNNLNFINDEKEETIDVFNFVLNLCAAAVRNWDITFVNKVNEFTVIIEPNSDIITVPSTFGIVPGMLVSSGSQFPDNTRVTQIISETQVRVSNPAFDDIGEFGYPPLTVSVGAEYDVTQEEIYSTVTNAGSINVQLPGILISSIVRGAVSQVTFYLSNINNGTFYDASNLIEENIDYIKEEILGYILDNYTISSNVYITNNVEDYINAVIYHLRYSGNAKIIQFGRKFYIDDKLIITSSLKDIIIDALDKCTDLMLLAMRNSLPSGTYTSIIPFVDEEVLSDSNIPTCVDVATSITSFKNNINRILNKGENTVRLVSQNSPQSGNWTDLSPYTNNNITLDDPLFNSECQDVLSAINSLSGAINDTLNNGKGTIQISPPDYFNGETDIFELYYENGDIVKTDPNENLIISINGIVQYNNSYTIIRSENELETDKVKFSEIPKWDQDENSLNLQEATAVEKAFAYSIGSYEVLTINKELIPFIGKGPYLIIDSIKETVRKIDDNQYALVFINGVLQDSDAYTINGPNIIFSEKLAYFTSETGQTELPNIEIRLLYGRDIEKTLTFYNFERDTYTNVIKTVFFGSGSYDLFVNWLRDGVESEGALGGSIKWYSSEHSDVFIYQFIEDTEELKLLGILKGYRKIDSGSWEIKFSSSINHTLIENTDLGFTGPRLIFTKELDSDNFLNIVLDLLVPLNEIFVNTQDSVYGTITVEGELVVELGTSISSRFAEIVYSDSQGDIIQDFSGKLERNSARWIFDSILKEKYWKENSSLYANIREGDQIQIDGEKDRREIISIPEVVSSTNFNKDQIVTDSFYGTIKATNYNDITRGEGLSVVAIIENGRVVALDWNKRDWQLYFQNNILLNPTAYQYYTPPTLHFIPTNNQGGGARAEVITYGGDILDIVLIDGGSGYTEPPRVAVGRSFSVFKKDNRIIDHRRTLVVNTNIFTNSTSNISSQIVILSPSVSDIISITSESLVTPLDYDTKITSIIEPDEKSVSPAVVQVIIPPFVQIVPKLFVNSVVSSERQVQNIVATRFNVISSSTIQSVERQVNLNIKKVITDAIHLNPLPTVNDIGAFLQIDFDINDTIIYIANTRNFPDSGRLLVGNEIVTYDSKLADRFLNVTRGIFNTVPSFHAAGDYLRNLPDFTTIVPVGPVQIVTAESVISTVSTQPTEVIRVTSSFDEVENNVSVITSTSNVDLRLQLLRDTSVTAISNQTTVLYGIEEQVVRSIKLQTLHQDTKVQSIVNIDADSSLVSSSSEISILDYSTVTNISSTTNTITAVTKQIEVSFVSVDEVSVYNSSSEYSVNLNSVETVSTNKVDIISTESTVDIGINLLRNISINSIEKQLTASYATDYNNVQTITTIYNNTELKDIVLLDVETSISAYSTQITQVNDAKFDTIASVVNSITSVEKIIDVEIVSTESVVLANSSSEYSINLNSVESVYSAHASIVSTSVDLHSIIKTGSIDYVGDETYNLGSVTPSLSAFDTTKFDDTGVADVSTLNIELIDLYYPELTVGDFADRSNSSYTASGDWFNLSTPTINEYGTIMTSGISDSEISTIQVFGTSGFPSSGKLLVGNEIIYYTSKTSTSFNGLTRGQEGTTAQVWNTNQYIRSLN